jgi:large repetitive protein
MMHLMTRMKCALATVLTFALGGCTSLLGDFSYDENVGRRGIQGTPAQGDIVVTPVKGLVTTESGGKATFTIVLTKEPTKPVFIGLSTSNANEGLVSPQTLTFTTDNYAAPQMVQVTGVDDALEDGAQVYVIETSVATSEDPYFLGLDPLDVEVTNTDNDTAGVTVTPPGGLVTSESGAEATFTIQLNKAPSADVTIPLSTDKPTEGIVSPALVSFTPDNWMAPQTVTVTGVNDDAKDGEQPYLVLTDKTTSTDAKYDGLDVPDVRVTNLDNDTAGIVLSPSENLITFESGLMTSLTIALSSPPTADVVVGLTSSDTSEGLVSPASVTFTPANWMAPQVVSVTGVEDTRVDGDQPFKVETKVLSSDDTDYLTLAVLPKADAINVDNDFARIVVDPMAGLTTSEDLDAATFSVMLLSKPAGMVKVDVASQRLEEGVASPPLLTFTEENWAAPQTVTVMGVNDDVADGPQSYIVRVKPNPETVDANYLSLLEQDVMLSNVDNDSAGFRVRVDPSTGLLTTESGGTATFTIELTSQPKATVTIPLVTSDDSEGTVSPNQLVFTTDNYKSAQTVTVRGVNDDRQDGDQPYRIITQAPISEDADYAQLDVPNVDCRNQDDDSAGITVDPTNKTLVTAENGLTATFTVRLNSEPRNEVTLTMTSTDPLEGTVSPATLKFTASNWRAPQTVTVKGQQDSVNDGDRAYQIRFGTVQSDDANYAGDKLRPLDVRCSNIDDDSAFIRLINHSGLSTSEKAGSAPATFQVALGSQPKANVSIPVSSNRTSEGTVSPATLQFTPINWASPQTVTITGVDEKVQDGPQQFLVLIAPSTSNDGDYNGILPNPSTVSVTNQDDDSAGILVKAAANLATSEPDGMATFTVELTSQPTANVTIPLASSNTKEGTVSPASLTFTPANWSAPRTVTLTGVNDNVEDGNQQYSISVGPSTSTDAKYNPKTAADVKVVNIDDDTATILVSAVSGATNEDGVTASFTIALQTQPTADVSVGVSSTRPSEGTVNPTSVTFTQANWASPQRITVTGVNDDMQDGDQLVRIDIAAATSKDANYEGLDAADVMVTNRDNDTAEVQVIQLSNRTSESGETATFSVALRTQPSGGAMVALSLSSSNVDEGTLSAASLTFTDVNWRSPQIVTVTGVEDDSTADGDQPFTVSFGAAKSADPNYQGKQPLPLSFTNRDNDTPGIVVAPLTGETSEDLETMSFTVVLQSKPKANVQILVASTDTTEGTVSTPSLTFTSANWSAKQTVTVTGVNDDAFDGSPSYKVTLSKPTSTDEGYAELEPDDVSLINVDNDLAGFVVSSAEGNTTEGGGKTRFSIKLRSQPKGPVTITLRSSDDAEGSLQVDEVVLTPTNWNVPQWVDVSGEDDMKQDGDQVYTIITGASSSPTDPDYDDKVVPDVSVKNLDNDTAGFVVGPVSGHTNEAGGTATFTVALKTEPAAGVSLTLTSSNVGEGTVAAAPLSFSITNWSVPQIVTVTGVDDEVADGNIEYKIRFGPATSTDPNYSGKAPADVTITNDDDDSAALLVTMPTATITGEAATAPSVTFQVALSSQPKANVTVSVKSSNLAEGTISIPMMGELTFTPSNWSTKQNVVVQGVDDAEDDAEDLTSYVITVGPPESTDAGYATLAAQTVTLQNEDDD